MDRTFFLGGGMSGWSEGLFASPPRFFSFLRQACLQADRRVACGLSGSGGGFVRRQAAQGSPIGYLKERELVDRQRKYEKVEASLQRLKMKGTRRRENLLPSLSSFNFFVSGKRSNEGPSKLRRDQMCTSRTRGPGGEAYKSGGSIVRAVRADQEPRDRKRR